MKRLILMRHAKSSWKNAGLSDHDRPLNGRGRRSATALGEWMKANKFIPDQILSSTSERTRETWKRLGLVGEPAFETRLYHAEPGRILSTLQEAEGTVVLMLGHNPGIGDLAQDIVAEAPGHSRFADYPTGATLVVDFDIDNWSMLHPRTGRPCAFVVPRDLTED